MCCSNCCLIFIILIIHISFCPITKTNTFTKKSYTCSFGVLVTNSGCGPLGTGSNLGTDHLLDRALKNNDFNWNQKDKSYTRRQPGASCLSRGSETEKQKKLKLTQTTQEQRNIYLSYYFFSK